jgi:uncharacterized pyridoxamine 5'-phosphate oxidase family protein
MCILGVVEYRRSVNDCYARARIVAKKNDKIYIIEVKTKKALRYLKKELDWLMLAKEYGFLPVVATVDVKIEARDLVIEEL